MFVPRHETTHSRCPTLTRSQRPAAPNRTLPPGLRLKPERPPPPKALTRHCQLHRAGRHLARAYVSKPRVHHHGFGTSHAAAAAAATPRGRDDGGARRLRRRHGGVGADDVDHPRARRGGVGVVVGGRGGVVVVVRRLVLGLARGVPRRVRRGRRRRRRGRAEGPDAAAAVRRRERRGQPAADGAVPELQRADAGHGAVLRAGDVLLQLPAGRRRQPLYTRLLRHHPVPRLAGFAFPWRGTLRPWFLACCVVVVWPSAGWPHPLERVMVIRCFYHPDILISRSKKIDCRAKDMRSSLLSFFVFFLLLFYQLPDLLTMGTAFLSRLLLLGQKLRCYIRP